MKKFLSLFALITVTGCANVSHHRVMTYAVDGTRTVDETETARFFFQKEAAQKIQVQTKDNGTNYSHGVSATGVSASGDVELIKAIGDAIGEGIGAAAKTTIKP